MSETHLDHPGDISWFKGYGPANVLGPCPHVDCPHTATSVIAWGPDFEHYTLNACDIPEGCDGYCRGWAAEYPYGEGPQFKLGQMLLTDWSERVLSRERKAVS